MKKKILRLLFWLSAILLLLVSSASVILYLNKDKLIAQVVGKVNEQLEVPVSVSSIDVSLRTFPLASLELREVFCQGANALPQDTLLYAQRLYFEFDLWQVFREDISVRRISLYNGTLHLRVPATGNPNYEIWKSDTTNSTTQNFVALDEVELVNFRSRLWEGNSKTALQGHTHSLKLQGRFSADDFSFQSTLQIRVDSLKVADEGYLRNEEVLTSLALSGTEKEFNIREGRLELAGLAATYQVDYNPQGTVIHAQAESLNIEPTLQFIARQGWYQSPAWQLNGQLSAVLKAEVPSEGDLSLRSELQTTNLSLKGEDGAQLKNIKAQARYNYNGQQSDLFIEHFQARGKSGDLGGKLSIHNLDRPLVEAQLKSELDLAEWLLFFPTDTIISPSGKVSLDLYFKNQFSSFENISPHHLKSATTKGSIQLEQLAFAFKNSAQKIKNINSRLSFSNSNLDIETLSLQLNESRLQLSGRFLNVINFAFFDGQTLTVDAKLTAEEIRLEDFLSIQAGKESKKSAAKESEYSLALTHQLQLQLDLFVKHFSFEAFEANNIRGKLSVGNGLIEGRQISLEADQGQYNGSFKVNTYLMPHVLQANLRATGIQLHEVFLSFKNFGQEAILAENIYGKADIDLYMKARMDPQLNIDPASLEVQATVAIDEGRLSNYDPMLALGDYADISELKQVQFASLRNEISIRNSVITVPRMEVHSNVMDLGLQGTHDFENLVNYSISLKMSDVLFNARKKKNRRSEFDEHLTVKDAEDDPYIYIKLKGPAEDPDITLDKKELGRSIGRDISKQGQELREVFSRDKPKSDSSSSGIQYDLFGDEDDK